MKGIVERFEGSYAVIEIAGKAQDVPRSAVSFDVKVGDCVILHKGIWVVDREATKKRTLYMKKLIEDVWND
ncbi:DUF3006 domain-containing protein [Paenibacillus ginsengarvi]|uniref:DUF3006 domain-containing protein n=1 Tax=Paenibacillus ginsengarvi TaxID=400777 RepID=A0A3B0B4Q1_9BACL|nr:DUF3006 domain-containing protein [Paenibacillus ginsengarvi]RKN66026.1 DUF3006 domain-containing protein [Paenibacillus ginsengarvi]